MRTTIVNLMGGPGSGKSTLAAGVFYALKSRLISCELVREYVKDWAWQGRAVTKYDEVYLYAKQLQAESKLYGKVDYIVTDSPLYMSTAYEKLHTENTIMQQLFSFHREQQKQGGISHVDLTVRRTKPYIQQGRFHGLDSAIEVDKMCIQFGPYVDTIEDVLKHIGVDGPGAK